MSIDVKEKLLQLHRQEDEMNKQIGKLDKEIRVANRKKAKLAKMVSSNMKYRNKLINKL